jgi:NADPH2:quinone reductase
MNTIQAVRLGEPDVLEYTNLPDPVPAPDQVLIEVRGASVNYADIKARSGAYHLGKKPPYTPGLDVAGVVLEVGSGVTQIMAGDHVIAFPASGSYAEKCVATEGLTFVIPKQLSFITAAAAALVAGTATHMLTQVARISEGESLLVHAAAGGVGSTALQVAQGMGLSQVFGSIGSSWKEDHVKKMGCDAVISYTADGYAEDIKRLTGGTGVDVILNPIGGPTIGEDLKCLAPFGRLILFGELSDVPAHIPPAGLYTTNRTILGFSFGHYRRFRPDQVRKTMHSVIDMLANGRLDVIVGKRFSLKDAAEAHRCLEKRQAVGKVVLIPDTSNDETS